MFALPAQGRASIDVHPSSEVSSFDVVCHKEDEESTKSTIAALGSRRSIQATWPSSSAGLQFFGMQLSHEASVQADPALTLKDPELLRGVPARYLLRSVAMWTSADAVLQSTFDLSKPVREIDIFLSHSWLAVGWLKVVAVAYHTNIRRAVVLSLLVLILTLLPEFWGTRFPIPPTHQTVAVIGTEVHQGKRWQLRSLLPSVTFLVLLRFGQELRFGSTCFLDKCCIHQTDESKKQAGIRQLGAFLHASKSLLVLWQPEYLTRLWCVYELAAFVYIKGGDLKHVVFRPTSLLAFVAGLFTFHLVATVSLELLAPVVFAPWHMSWVADAVPEAAQPWYISAVMFAMLFGMYVPVAPLLWYFCKSYMRHRSSLLHQLRFFSFASAQCREESDRVYVQEQVRKWFGSVERFEEFVRVSLAGRVESLLEQQGPVPYRLVFVGVLPHVFSCVSIMVNMWIDGTVGFVQFVCCAVVLVVCADAISIRLLMALADTTFGDWPQGEKASVIQRVKGPLMASLIASSCSSIAAPMLSPALPEWIAITTTACFVVATVALYAPRGMPNLCGVGRRDDETRGHAAT